MSTPFAYWQPNHTYSANSYILDGIGNIQFTSVTGMSGANPPAWTTSTTPDGTLTWVFVGFGARAITFQPSPPNEPGLVQNSTDATSYSRGTIDAGKIVLLDETGQLDPSMGGGGGGGSAWGTITSGNNSTADMIVSGVAQLVYSGTGIINANELGGVLITNIPAHIGQIPIVSQITPTLEMNYADPLIQGLYAAGSSIATPPPFATPTTIQPVLVGAASPTGFLQNLNVDASGNLFVWVQNAGSSTVNQGNQGSIAQSWFTEITDGTNVIGTVSHPLYVQGTVSVSGTVTSNIQASSVPLTATGSSLNVNITGGASSDAQYPDGTTNATPTGTVAM